MNPTSRFSDRTQKIILILAFLAVFAVTIGFGLAMPDVPHRPETWSQKLADVGGFVLRMLL